MKTQSRPLRQARRTCLLLAGYLFAASLYGQQPDNRLADAVTAASIHAAEILEGVKDAGSAQAAQPRLEQAVQAYEAAVRNHQNTRGAKPDKGAGERMSNAYSRLMQAVAAVRKNADAAKVLAPILARLDSH